MEPIAVRLRPFEERDLWYFDRLPNDREFSEPFEWGGFCSPASWRRRWHERVGPLREGCVRGHHFRDGQWRDGYLYGLTRDDWIRRTA
jgi:hypothetical protein